MPTIPPPPSPPPSQPSPPSPPQISELSAEQRRTIAESFGTDAARYDRARPRYPQPLIDRIVAACPGREVLDVGCGTGIVARQLQAAGCRVLGVEPDQRMAGLARQFGVEVEIATIESWDPAGREFDAVVAGQAWHWIDPVAGAAKAAQALRPGGLFAAFWNSQQPPPELAKATGEVVRRALPNLPFQVNFTARPEQGYASLAAKATNGLRETGSFGEAEQWQFDWEQAYNRNEWLDQLPTSGCLTKAPPEVVAEVLAGVGAVIDEFGGSFTATCVTIAVVAKRISTAD
jgi:SAM-dependent methyltransferase